MPASVTAAGSIPRSLLSREQLAKGLACKVLSAVEPQGRHWMRGMCEALGLLASRVFCPSISAGQGLPAPGTAMALRGAGSRGLGPGFLQEFHSRLTVQ